MLYYCLKCRKHCQERRPTTKVTSTVKQLLHTKFTGNTATGWGILQESATNEQYLKCKQTESPDISTTSTGLVISNDHPWLAASPDGLEYNPLEDPPYGVVEFKNPYSARNSTLCEAAIKVKGFCLQYNPDTNKLGLKKNMIISTKFNVPCIALKGGVVTL